MRRKFEGAPAPDGGSLAAEVVCTAPMADRPGTTHVVTINPDWSFSTTHNEELERVAAALGAVNPCVVALSNDVAAFRHALSLFTRRSVPTLLTKADHAEPRLWTVSPSPQCCDGTRTFASPSDAARHSRTVEHISGAESCRAPVLTALLEAAIETWDGFPLPSVPPDLERRVQGGRSGLIDLWQAGVHPTTVQHAADAAYMVSEPLPTGYYLAAAYRGRIDDLPRRTLEADPDPSLAEWFAWNPNPTATSERLQQLGIRGRSMVYALSYDISPIELEEVGIALNRAPALALQPLLLWKMAGLAPTAWHFARMNDHGRDLWRNPPSTREIKKLEDGQIKTDLGLLLALIRDSDDVRDVVIRSLRTAIADTLTPGQMCRCANPDCQEPWTEQREESSDDPNEN